MCHTTPAQLAEKKKTELMTFLQCQQHGSWHGTILKNVAPDAKMVSCGPYG